MNREDVLKRLNEVPFWWHSIQFAPDLATPGFKSSEHLKKELSQLDLPDLADKTVLDIGAWDGFYSFEAEKRGSKHVVALDHYSWSVDWGLAFKYWQDCKKKGIVPEPFETLPELWKPGELPGQKGFALAREILESKVEPLVADFMSVDLQTVGQFDVVFYLGVLYHMKDPFESVRRLASVTRSLAIIETEALVLSGYEDHAMMEFYETNELNGDVSNWWAPNHKCLAALCRASGFRRVETMVAPPEPALSKEPFYQRFLGRKPRNLPLEPLHYRAIVHAYK